MVKAIVLDVDVEKERNLARRQAARRRSLRRAGRCQEGAVVTCEVLGK